MSIRQKAAHGKETTMSERESRVKAIATVYLALLAIPCNWPDMVATASQDAVALFPFQSSVTGSWGYIDVDGRIILKAGMRFAGEFSEGLAVVQVAGRYGYIDKNGSMIVNPQYDNARDFSEGLAAVEIAGKYGYIDKSGALVVKPQYQHASEFVDGLAAVTLDLKTGYIDRSGRWTIRPQFDTAATFSEGLALVGFIDPAKGFRAGYIDKSGTAVVKPVYEDADGFSEGLAAVRQSNSANYGYIGKSGSVVIRPQFEDAKRFSEGLAAVTVNGKYGFIDKSGNLVIKPQYDDATAFSEGLAAVSSGRRYGYIGRNGHWVIQPVFSHAEPFRENLALVGFETNLINHEEHKVVIGREGYIDHHGVTKFRWKTVHNHTSGGGGPGGENTPIAEITIESTPAGAMVYLIPLDEWDLEKHLIDDKTRLSQYLLTVYTPVRKERVIEQVYVALLQVGGRTIKRTFDVNLSHINRLEVDFAKEPQP